MANTTFATIYIGSYEVSLKIFEVNSKKKIHEVDHVRSRIDLGRDVYQTGKLGYEKVDELCDTLSQFSQIAESYWVTHIQVYASAVIRDAENELFIINQIFIRTGLTVNLLSNSEHRLITYKSVAGKTGFEQMIQTSAVVLDLGGSGMQITLFRNGKLITTQHIDIGTLRIRNILGDRGMTLARYEREIEEFISKKIEVFCSIYLKEGVEYCIILNDYAMELIKNVGKKGALEEPVKAEKFVKYIEKLQIKTLEEITADLNLSNDKDPFVIPTISTFRAITLDMKASLVWVPRVNVNDGIAYDYCER
ncbi:MAG: phosphatase, partial [Lachnospiraceae bacterium]|nr:phosphatase [Lachnospiraceae bacterium]